MVVLHSRPTRLSLAVARARLGPYCNILHGRSWPPRFHPKGGPSTIHQVAAGAGTLRLAGLGPFFPSLTPWLARERIKWEHGWEPWRRWGLCPGDEVSAWAAVFNVCTGAAVFPNASGGGCSPWKPSLSGIQGVILNRWGWTSGLVWVKAPVLPPSPWRTFQSHTVSKHPKRYPS